MASTTITVPLVIVAMAGIAAGCGPSLVVAEANGFQAQAAAQVSYSPPIVPLKFGIKVPTGEVEVSAGTTFVTPIGVFAMDTMASVVKANQAEGRWTVIVALGAERHLYKLEPNIQPSVTGIPTDYEGNASLVFDSGARTVTLSIPNPSRLTLAGLQAKIDRLADENAAKDQANESLRRQLADVKDPYLQAPPPPVYSEANPHVCTDGDGCELEDNRSTEEEEAEENIPLIPPFQSE